MTRKSIKYSIFCTGIVIGFVVIDFLLVQETNVVSVRSALAADLSVISPDKATKIKTLLGVDLIYSDFFPNVDNRANVLIQTQVAQLEKKSDPAVISTEPIKYPIKKTVENPRITAPRPVSYDNVNGKLVCDKKNDHPTKSKKGKGKHLDMECCFDPDEYPNPWCYYPKEKYGKYL